MLLVGLGPTCSIPNQPGGLPTLGPAEPLLPLSRFCSLTPHLGFCLLSPQHVPISLQPSWPAPAVPTPPPMIQIPTAIAKLRAQTMMAWGARDFDRHFALS